MSPKGHCISNSLRNPNGLFTNFIRVDLHNKYDLIHSRFVVTTQSEVLAYLYSTARKLELRFSTPLWTYKQMCVSSRSFVVLYM